ncbi:hypothetical protein D3C85_1268400 [compost metagenome]
MAPSLINQLPPYKSQSLSVALLKFSLKVFPAFSGTPITGKLLILIFSDPNGVSVISSVCSDEAAGVRGTSSACILWYARVQEGIFFAVTVSFTGVADCIKGFSGIALR